MKRLGLLVIAAALPIQLPAQATLIVRIAADTTMRYAALFDLNSVELGSIEAIEVYSSGSNLPAEFQRTGGGCGAVLIWMRVSR